MPRNISINITKDDALVIDALVAGDPLLNRHAVARLGLRLGLKALTREPGRIPEMLRGQAVHVLPVGAPSAEEVGGVR
jgi:hypothetical protein